MVTLKVVGSGSDGNGYILDDGQEILVIECGVPIAKLLPFIDFKVTKIKGCIVSHCHGDHAKYVTQYRDRGRVVYLPYESPERERQIYQIGRFTVKTFGLVHDVPCFGFLIEHPDMGKLLYATDTEYIKYTFRDLDNIIIEANYAFDLLDDEQVDNTKRDHVLRGHMELSTSIRCLEKNCGNGTQNVILAHLSKSNADADMWLTTVQPLVECTVWIAKKGLELRLKRGKRNGTGEVEHDLQDKGL